VLFVCFETGSHYIAQASLEFVILCLSLPSLGILGHYLITLPVRHSRFFILLKTIFLVNQFFPLANSNSLKFPFYSIWSILCSN
jgi:hypothetical protein